jgi:hypothetical protein
VISSCRPSPIPTLPPPSDAPTLQRSDAPTSPCHASGI